MKHITIDNNGIETVTTMTRGEILALHAGMTQRHSEKMTLLESLHYGKHFDQITLDNAKANQEEAESKVEAGLTTEINTSGTLVNVGDTVEGCMTILRKHPHGFKMEGRLDKAGATKTSYTQEENEEAAAWMASLVKPCK